MKKVLSTFIILFLLSMNSVIPCTTILVTKGASEDGSVFVAHSDDDELLDQRIVYVPAKDHKKGTKRPVYYSPACYGGSNIRYVGTSRGKAYENPDLPQTEPLGYIDQVPHTYAYFDGNYGIMNEHQLMFGECTNGAKIELKPKKGKRIFYSAELSRVALERCTKAREAVKLIGELIDKYGYYGTGETLLVGDTQEGWVIEMCCGTMNEKGGLWVAKKVPDGEIFAAANEFRIREIDPDDPDMMYSKNLFETAKKRGWWDPKKDPKLDWLRVVSNGEYNHPYYSLRRVWRLMSRISPSSNFSPWVEDGYTKQYPFSVKPDKKLTVKDVMSLYRDHYEGTEFDLTKGISAGPFGCPYRYVGKYDGAQNDVSTNKNMWGAWERPISVFYCGYVFVNQARDWLPDYVGGISWIGLDKPYLTCFVPFYVGITDLPKSYQTGTTDKFDRNTAWWAFNFVANYAQIKFSHMKEDILALQSKIEDEEFASQDRIESEAENFYKTNPVLAKDHLTNYCTNNAGNVLSQWWKLSDMLIQKYNDGFINEPKIGQEIGYPKEWLEKTDYSKGSLIYQKPEEK